MLEAGEEGMFICTLKLIENSSNMLKVGFLLDLSIYLFILFFSPRLTEHLAPRLKL